MIFLFFCLDAKEAKSQGPSEAVRRKIHSLSFSLMKKKQKIKLHSKEIACGTVDEAWLHAFPIEIGSNSACFTTISVECNEALRRGNGFNLRIFDREAAT